MRESFPGYGGRDQQPEHGGVNRPELPPPRSIARRRTRGPSAPLPEDQFQSEHSAAWLAESRNGITPYPYLDFVYDSPAAIYLPEHPLLSSKPFHDYRHGLRRHIEPEDYHRRLLLVPNPRYPLTTAVEQSCRLTAERWLENHPRSISAKTIAREGVDAAFGLHVQLVRQIFRNDANFRWFLARNALGEEAVRDGEVYRGFLGLLKGKLPDSDYPPASEELR